MPVDANAKLKRRFSRTPYVQDAWVTKSKKNAHFHCTSDDAIIMTIVIPRGRHSVHTVVSKPSGAGLLLCSQVVHHRTRSQAGWRMNVGMASNVLRDPMNGYMHIPHAAMEMGTGEFPTPATDTQHIPLTTIIAQLTSFPQ